MDLQAAVGALQLCPQNANFVLRFEALAHAVGAVSAGGKHEQIDQGRLRAFCDNPPIGESFIAQMEDPADHLFSEAISFFGGSYTIIPGLAERIRFDLQILLQSMFLVPDNGIPRTTLRDLRRKCIALLTVSQLMSQRAGLVRGIAPSFTDTEGVFVPSDPLFQRLKSAVTFQKEWLEQYLQKTWHLHLDDLRPFVTNAGSVRTKDYSLDNGPLLSRPLIDHGDAVLVAIPSTLAAALKHYLITSLQKTELCESFSPTLIDALWISVMESLSFMGLPRPAQVDGTTVDDTGSYRTAFVPFDKDCSMQVVVLSDTLSAYQPQTIRQMWDGSALAHNLVDVLRDPQSREQSAALQLIIVHPIGQGFELQLPEECSGDTIERLFLNADELRAIALVDPHDPLLLWNFARRRTSARKRLHIISTSVLDEYAFYRECDQSFYATDNQLDALYMQPGYGVHVRIDAAHRLDDHGVLRDSRGTSIEVVALHGTHDIPLYVPRFSPDRVELFVEGVGLALWVVSPPLTDPIRPLREVLARFADAIGYWIWKLHPYFDDVVQALCERTAIATIEVSIDPSDPWNGAFDDIDAMVCDPIEMYVDADVNRVRVHVRANIALDFGAEEPLSERALVHTVWRGLSVLADTISLEHDQRLSDVVARFGPSGDRRRFYTVDSGLQAELNAEDLPRVRMIQSGNESDLLDELGDYLRDEKDLSVGEIPSADKTDVLRGIVGWCFRELTTEIAHLTSDGLTEELLLMNEAFLQQDAHRRVNIVSELACFSDEPVVVERLRNELREHAQASIALRFLIELVAAQPPSGDQNLSLRLFDRLLAMASQLFNFGMQCDLIHYEVADMDMSILPSGRLGRNREDFEAAMALFSRGYASEFVHESQTRVREMWRQRTPDQVATNERVEKLNQASIGEFGASFDHFIDIIMEGANISIDTEQPVVRIPKTELIEQLSRRCNFDQAEVALIVDRLTLSPRPTFLDPPAPFRKSDVYPWKFGRELSLIRRPFLVNPSDGTLVFGRRQTIKSAQVLADRYLSGRLDAKTPVMRSLMATITHEIGEGFNDKVATTLEEGYELSVKKRVRRVGRLRCSDEEGDIGDIDVLAADSRAKTLYVIECKDFRRAATPRELRNELDQLFGGKKPEKGALAKLNRRVEWVRTNAAAIQEWLETPFESVEPVVVLDRQLLGPILERTSVPFVPLSLLQRNAGRGTPLREVIAAVTPHNRATAGGDPSRHWS